MLRKTLLLLSIVLIVALLTGGCTDMEGIDGAIEGVGTISSIESGDVYIIEGEDGTRYAPVNLEENYRNDDMRIYFRGVILTDTEASGSPGTPIEIHSIGTYVPPETNASAVLVRV